MSKTRVLVVDGDRRFTRLVRVILEQAGTYEVMIVSQATHAAKAALQFQPHVMLLNVDIPDEAGADMARATAASGRLRDIPVIFLTPRIRRRGSCYPAAGKSRDETFSQADRALPASHARGRRCSNINGRLDATRTVPWSPGMEKMEKPIFDFLVHEKVAHAGRGGSGR